ncbi:MAG TPA: TlyA family RNA methyltransferase [Candidatus Aminicenantes bacterium]|nr:TlyA family RNA methyltransferase [Candidatus Aminicenantes bacterium]HRY64108.1 TlyA family RNA methyltransferase [Candidatus Aminicenantes bacterium]HRZ71021.1 TlyA family RNA methyltransferase [Candidatus Aminicenantes bacterium]
MKERADKLLAGRGLAPSREKAQALIMAGLVTSAGRAVGKPGELLDAEAPLEVAHPLPFVSRGGLKLEEALARFGIDVAGLVGLDVGASTGGFVDCLLKRGAARVYAVDVDTRQLDWSLSKDPRVVRIEKNARALVPADIPEPPGIVTMDVSFISVVKILPVLAAIPGDWALVSLVKPQFEAGPKDVGKKGVVRDPAVHAAVLERVVAAARAIGFGLKGLIRCSTHGQKGNVEFFAWWVKGAPELNSGRIPEWIKEAVRHE